LTCCVEAVVIVLFAGDVTATTGPVLSIFNVTDALAVAPFASVAVAEMVWFAPSVLTVCAAGHWTGGAPPVHEYVTVTLLLFHPFAFAAGDGDAVIASGATTVNVAELLEPAPGTVTTTDAAPKGTPAGTGAVILVSLHVAGVAAMPAKVTLLLPRVAPKLVPLIVTTVPIGPAVGARLVITGVTVNCTLLLAWPPTVTTTGPEVAPDGTTAVMLVLLHCAGVAA